MIFQSLKKKHFTNFQLENSFFFQEFLLKMEIFFLKKKIKFLKTIVLRNVFNNSFLIVEFEPSRFV